MNYVSSRDLDPNACWALVAYWSERANVARDENQRRDQVLAKHPRIAHIFEAHLSTWPCEYFTARRFALHCRRMAEHVTARRERTTTPRMGRGNQQGAI